MAMMMQVMYTYNSADHGYDDAGHVYDSADHGYDDAGHVYDSADHSYNDIGHGLGSVDHSHNDAGHVNVLIVLYMAEQIIANTVAMMMQVMD